MPLHHKPLWRLSQGHWRGFRDPARRGQHAYPRGAPRPARAPPRPWAMDTLGFEPRAFCMRSGCDATTPCALEGKVDGKLGSLATPCIKQSIMARDLAPARFELKAPG